MNDFTPNRRFEDSNKSGMDDPLVLLGQLHSRVGALERNTEKNTETLETIASDITEIKISRAGEAGQKRGLLSGVNLVILLGGFGATIATAWATVKATAISPPH